MIDEPSARKRDRVERTLEKVPISAVLSGVFPWLQLFFWWIGAGGPEVDGLGWLLVYETSVG